MKFNPEIHHRKSIRLKNYDYSQAGLYFITICTHSRLPLFGTIIDGVMHLNEMGKLAHDEWLNTEIIRPHIVLYAFIVMPNHLHGIIEITSGIKTVGARCMRPGSGMLPDSLVTQRHELGLESGREHRAPTVGGIVRGYKSAVTKGIRAMGNDLNSIIWQRNYYEHIIRNEAAYLKIADYIQTNPKRWLEDIYHV